MNKPANPSGPTVAAPTCNAHTHCADAPPPVECGPGSPAHGLCCLHLLPPHAHEGLKLTCDQQKQVADLEVETKAKLHKILTPEQLQQLKQMRPPPPKGGPGCCIPQTKPGKSVAPKAPGPAL